MAIAKALVATLAETIGSSWLRIEFKKAFIKAKDEDIQIIKSPVGMPGRSIFNKFLQEANEGKRKPVWRSLLSGAQKYGV